VLLSDLVAGEASTKRNPFYRLIAAYIGVVVVPLIITIAVLFPSSWEAWVAVAALATIGIFGYLVYAASITTSIGLFESGAPHAGLMQILRFEWWQTGQTRSPMVSVNFDGHKVKAAAGDQFVFEVLRRAEAARAGPAGVLAVPPAPDAAMIARSGTLLG